MIDNRTISNWVRQARYRARKHQLYSDVTVEDIQQLLTEPLLCDYCATALATIIDCPFPLRDGVPNIPANLAFCCKTCKTTKSTNDVVWLFINHHLPQDLYLSLIAKLCGRRGGEIIKTHIRQATGRK